MLAHPTNTVTLQRGQLSFFERLLSEVQLQITRNVCTSNEAIEPKKDIWSADPTKFVHCEASTSAANLSLTCKSFENMINGRGLFHQLNRFRLPTSTLFNDFLRSTVNDRMRAIQSIHIEVTNIFGNTCSIAHLMLCSGLQHLSIHFNHLGEFFDGSNDKILATPNFMIIGALQGLKSFEIEFDGDLADRTSLFHASNGVSNADKLPVEKNVRLRIVLLQSKIASRITSIQSRKTYSPSRVAKVQYIRARQIAGYNKAQLALHGPINSSIMTNNTFTGHNIIDDIVTTPVTNLEVPALTDEEVAWA